MQLDLPYNQPKEAKLSNAELTVDYINHAVSLAYEKGLHGTLRRVWGRLQRKLDEALENKNYIVELDDAEKDFIKKAFKSPSFDLDFPAHLSKFVIVLEEEIEKL